MKRLIMFTAFLATLTFAPSAMAVTPQVAAGASHTCAVSDAGALSCWGANNSGQLGDGTTNPSPVPVAVPGLIQGVAGVAAETDSTCALLVTGKVDCWGYNFYGETGNLPANALPHPTPTEVPGLSGVTQVGGGYSDFCALIDDGSVKCWGANGYGQLGNNTADGLPHATPVTVHNLAGAVQLGVGEFHNCALIADGTEKCWGYDAAGMLGNGPGNIDSHTAQPVLNLTGATALFSSSYTSCAVAGGGFVKCWGTNNSGQMGIVAPGAQQTPVDVPDLSGIVALGGQTTTTCALGANGSLRCFGTLLGNGSPLASSTPTDVTDGADILAVSQNPAGGHICMIHRGGRVSCWGANDAGQLGDGASGVGLKSSAPVGVVGLDLITIPVAPISPTFVLAGKPKVDKKHKNYSLTASLHLTVPPSLAPFEACMGAFVTTTSYAYLVTKKVHGKKKTIRKTKTLKSSPQISSAGNECGVDVAFKLPVKYMNHKKLVISGAFAGNASLSAFNAKTASYTLPKVKPLKKKAKK